MGSPGTEWLLIWAKSVLLMNGEEGDKEQKPQSYKANLCHNILPAIKLLEQRQIVTCINEDLENTSQNLFQVLPFHVYFILKLWKVTLKQHVCGKQPNQLKWRSIIILIY